MYLATWGEWSAYGDCSVTCAAYESSIPHGGTQVSTRECKNGEPGDFGCEVDVDGDSRSQAGFERKNPILFIFAFRMSLFSQILIVCERFFEPRSPDCATEVLCPCPDGEDRYPGVDGCKPQGF